MKNITQLSMIIIFLLTSSYSFGQVVTKTIDDGTAGTLRTEIANAAPNTTITFDSSIQGQVINLTNGEIPLTNISTLTIDGDNGGMSTTISGNSNSRIFAISGGAATMINFNRVHFTDGTAISGGAIAVSGSTTTVNFTGCMFSNNIATGDLPSDGGGAIFNDGGIVSLTGGSFRTNSASGISGSGGAILNSNGGSVSTNSLQLLANSASRAGGAIEDNSGATGILNVNVTRFDDNVTGSNPGNGGGIHITGAGDSTITSSDFVNNTAANEGGGLWNGTGTMTIVDTFIDGNTASGNDTTVAGASGGGGIYNEGGIITIDALSRIINNVADGAQSTGGGVLNAGGTFTATGTLISNNTSNRAGGGIEQNQASITNLIGVTMIGNATGVITGPGAPGNGGALHVSQGGTVNITDGSFTQNTAANEGGGLWNGSGLMTISGNAVISENIASGEASMGAANPGEAGGGGIYNEGGDIVITGSVTVSLNEATGSTSTGGGILVAGGSFNATGAIINSNEANRAGGGIEANGGASVTLTSVTLNSNIAGVLTGPGAPGNGGGLHISGPSTVDVSNSTINTNIAMSEGGGLWNGTGLMTISGSTLDGNIASGDSANNGGGAIYALNGGSIIINQNSIISNNIADGVSGSGGGILIDADASLNINNSSVISNRANRAGGGLEIIAGNGVITLTDVILNNNNAGVSPAIAAPGSGGGLHITGDQDILITGGTVTSNNAANEGGGLWNGSGVMTITGNTVITDNTASGEPSMGATNPGEAGGGGIYNEGGDLVITGSVNISSNRATGSTSTGGGILVAGGSLNATGTIITVNGANRAGGGIEANGGAAVVLTGVVLNSNTAGVVTGPGAPGNGGGLHISGNSTVDILNSTINANIALSEGGGLWNGTGIMTVSSSTLDGNTASGAGADNGGGAIYALNGGNVIINQNTSITNNIADGTSGSGGGILIDADASLSVSNSVVSNNRANRAGGALEVIAGTGTISWTDVVMNNNNVGVTPAVAAPGNGGGIHITGNQDIIISGGSAIGNIAAREGGALWNGAGLMTISDLLLSDNVAQGVAANDGGGAIFNNGGDITATNITVSGNLATGTAGSGGALLSLDGDIIISNSSFENNAANRAGGAFEIINGSLDLSDTVISNNDVDGTAGTAAPGNGGALHISGVTMVTINDCIINNNIAASEGGGLWNQTGSTMIVMNSQLDGNVANGTGMDNGGGAIFNNGGDTQVFNSTLSNNSANGSHGGAVSNEVGTLSINVSTISTNTATLDGGGIYNNGTSVDLNAVTVGNNSASGSGGGVSNTSGVVTIKNSLIAENTASLNVDVSGAIGSAGFNLVEIDDSNAVTAQTTDLIGTTAAPEFASLGPLQDNGGGLFTHAIVNGSRAQDIGDPNDMFTDQRGLNVFGPARDAGAYEAQMTLSIESPFAGENSSLLQSNPVSNGVATVSLSTLHREGATYQVYDLSGKLLLSGALTHDNNSLAVDGLSGGAYLLTISSNTITETLRMIVN